MSNDITDTAQARWARFRFSIVGPLFSTPPLKGDLKQALVELSKRQWKHPITGVSIDFSVGTAGTLVLSNTTSSRSGDCFAF